MRMGCSNFDIIGISEGKSCAGTRVSPDEVSVVNRPLHNQSSLSSSRVHCKPPENTQEWVSQYCIANLL